MIIIFNNSISSSICKLPIRSEIYNCTFKNTNKVSIIIIKQPLLSVLCYFVVQGTSLTTDVLSDKGPKPKNEGKGSKGGSPFEEDTGEEIKKALQDEQGHESPKPVPKQTVEDDKTATTFR